MNLRERADEVSAEAATTAAEGAREHFDVVVIGAGQAGLVMGYFLARQGRRFVILEAGDSIGAAWRARWDSLVLFTPRRYSALAGLAFPGDPDGYPTRDEVIAYLERYAARFELPVELSSPAGSLSVEDGRFVVVLENRRLEARSSSPPVRSRSRAFRRSPASLLLTLSTLTAPAT
jgi:cation diffusion facilitator CzcD-associated flavoprotein CzcO